MRLTHIKLSGFKSFTDPTTIHVPGQLVAVIGPNGCGKSNVIDAVRWVLGEASAKQLRGESMQDVIFNGAATRRPAPRASVELVFDNSDHSLQGAWGQYAEVSIKRQLTRQGESTYFINNQTVRRRDITDLFLGTGVGARGYAVIEQGMISRIIEARPEELRAYIEEAAGVSKYKERRKETEGRLKDTREHLQRLGDLQNELARQVEKLEKQAETAERYKSLTAQLNQQQDLLDYAQWQQSLAAADKATALVAQDVAIDDGIETYRATQEDKVKWVEFLTKSDGSLEDPSLDKVKVADWVNKTAQESDVAPVNGVNNVDSEGKVLTVAREGKPGLKTNNTEQIIKDLMASLSDGKDYSGTFHYDDVAPSWDTKQVAEGTENLVYKAAEGEKWVDIDLSTDTVTAYVGGKVAGGPFYMVPGAPDTPTVTGTFHVYLKYESQTMRGENADGSKYETEGVPWVTYFTGSYAMHGAPWRSSFGWSGYGGSHGCVNMPVDAAKFMYDWADMGSTVVVHY